MTASPLRRALSVAAVAAAAWSAVGVAAAVPVAGAPAAAMIRGGHFSPDTPGVDVYLAAFHGGSTKLWLSGVGYGDVSPYQRFAPGLYAVSMRPHGAAASTPAALTWTLDARAGAAYTACAVGMNAQLHGIVLSDDMTAPAPSRARVRVIQAASRAGHARVSLSGGPVLASDVNFATTTKYTTVDAGSYTVDARAVSGASVHASAPLSLAADSVHTVVVLDGKSSGITLHVLDDAAGAATSPVGAVPAGGGGTATTGSSDRLAVVLLAGLAAALLALGGALEINRRRAPSRA
jgi:Domain of unknown function (DUF4397)